MGTMLPLGIAVAALTSAPGIAQAQIDYRNLDDGRPIATEDAYPIERYAFELMLPYRFDAERGGADLHLLAPRIEYGAFRNAQLGLEALLAGVDRPAGSDWGLAGVRVSGLYDFNTESAALPALALRADGFVPAGNLAGDAFRLTLGGIATRSWGATRAHLNGAVSLGSDDPGAAEEPARWSASAALDHTFIRRSLLVVGEVLTRQRRDGAPVEVEASAGVRWQWRPTLVLDAGMSRRLGAHGPDVGVTIGVSHAFAVAGLMPGRPR